MIDTTEAGAGSYPEPPEPKNKTFIITCSCSTKTNFGVDAENYEQAKEKLFNSEYDYIEFESFTIEDVEDYQIDG